MLGPMVGYLQRRYRQVNYFKAIDHHRQVSHLLKIHLIDHLRRIDWFEQLRLDSITTFMATIIVMAQHQSQRSHRLPNQEHSSLPVHLRLHTLQNQMSLEGHQISRLSDQQLVIMRWRHRQDSQQIPLKSLQH